MLKVKLNQMHLASQWLSIWSCCAWWRLIFYSFIFICSCLSPLSSQFIILLSFNGQNCCIIEQRIVCVFWTITNRNNCIFIIESANVNKYLTKKIFEMKLKIFLSNFPFWFSRNFLFIENSKNVINTSAKQ